MKKLIIVIYLLNLSLMTNGQTKDTLAINSDKIKNKYFHLLVGPNYCIYKESYHDKLNVTPIFKPTNTTYYKYALLGSLEGLFGKNISNRKEIQFGIGLSIYGGTRIHNDTLSEIRPYPLINLPINFSYNLINHLNDASFRGIFGIKLGYLLEDVNIVRNNLNLFISGGLSYEKVLNSKISLIFKGEIALNFIPFYFPPSDTYIYFYTTNFYFGIRKLIKP